MKIDAINAFKGLALCLFFLVMQGPLQAQIGSDDIGNILKLCDHAEATTTGNPNCPEGSVEVTFDNSFCNSAYLEMAFYVANLPGTPDQNGIYTWPSEYPEMILEYEYEPGLIKYTDPILEWEYSTNLNGHDVFQGNFIIELGFLEDNLNCLGSSSVSIPSFPARIVRQKTATIYSIYPVWQYSEPGDLMSCQVFIENCGLCDGTVNNEGCEGPGQADPIYDFVTCIDCAACDGNAIPADDPGSGDDRPHNRIDTSSPSFDIYPNPFSDNFTISYLAKQQKNVSLKMMNLDGKIILEKEFTVIEGMNSLELSTEQVNSGLYLVQILDDESNLIKQIMKVE